MVYSLSLPIRAESDKLIYCVSDVIWHGIPGEEKLTPYSTTFDVPP
jgi:hypothetical protein